MSKIYVISGCSTKDSLGYFIAEQIKKMDANNESVIVALANERDCDFDIHVSSGGCVDVISTCDLTKDYVHVLKRLSLEFPEIYCLINCAGLNSNSWFEDIKEKDFDNIMSVNAKAIYKISQALLPNIEKAKGTILNIVSNASHMAMTGSLCYNASKGASKMISSQMAHELTKKNKITVFSISPNKLSGTKMTKEIDEIVPRVRGWSKEYSDHYQDNSLKTGEKTDPKILAEFIAFLLSTKERHFFLSGCDIPYGA